MRTLFINYWERLRTSFWFIPSLMVLIAVCMSVVFINIDRWFGFGQSPLPSLFHFSSPEGARQVLATIAGSMITVAGVTFSITIVALNLASSQFGPRLLRNFMQDRGVQFVMGAFVASFIYCLLVLRAIQSSPSEPFVPGIAVFWAIAFAVINVFVLIYFIHHIATAIQADTIIINAAKELEQSIERIFNEQLEFTDDSVNTTGEGDLATDGSYHYEHQVSQQQSGYLQAINHEQLLSLATTHDYLIDLQIRPGQFAIAGSTLAVIYSADVADMAAAKAIADCFIIGEQRTQEQDVEYAVHQLVEIAVRSLSPGINDPYTALSCLDQLASALCTLAGRTFPPAYCTDGEGRVRLKLQCYSFSGMLNASFDQIRQYGQHSMATSIRLLEVLTEIARQSRYTSYRRSLFRQAEMIVRAARRNIVEENDLEDLLSRHRALLSVLNSAGEENEQYTL